MMNYGDTCHLRIALKLNIEIGNLSEQNCFCVFTYCGFRFKCDTHHGKSHAAWGLVGYTDLYFHGIPIVPLLGESIICFLGDLEAPGTLRT